MPFRCAPPKDQNRKNKARDEAASFRCRNVARVLSQTLMVGPETVPHRYFEVYKLLELCPSLKFLFIALDITRTGERAAAAL